MISFDSGFEFGLIGSSLSEGAINFLLFEEVVGFNGVIADAVFEFIPIFGGIFVLFFVEILFVDGDSSFRWYFEFHIFRFAPLSGFNYVYYFLLLFLKY